MKTFDEYRLPTELGELLRIIEQDIGTSERVLKFVEGKPDGRQVANQWFIMQVLERDGSEILPQEIVDEVKSLLTKYRDTLNKCCVQVATQLQERWGVNPNYDPQLSLEEQRGKLHPELATDVILGGKQAYYCSPEAIEIQNLKLDLERRMVSYLRSQLQTSVADCI